jgi:hypothetical protein
MKMQLEDIVVYTLTGKKHLYKLGDMSYGESLVFKDNLPVYYLDIFDKIYENIDESMKKDPYNYLNKKFRSEKTGYSMSQHIRGIWSSKINIKWFGLEKLPLTFFEKPNNGS